MYKIIINKKENKKDILILENDELIEQYEEKESSNRIEGNIYIGMPKNIINGMQAAFVDIGEKHNAFIHFKDIANKKIKINEPILVQVKKDAISRKGAKLSSSISLTGRYVVFMPYENFITISQKIEEESEKERLKEVVKQIIPKNYGAIIRTAAYEKDSVEIEKDIQELINKWEEIKNVEIDSVPKLIYKNDGLLEKTIKEFVDKDLKEIITNDQETYDEIKEIIKSLKEQKQVKIEQKESSIQELGLENKLSKLQERKIWLHSGAFITIDKTEALTAIDVNSGKYLGNDNLENTSYEVNAEATLEIAKQIRLRDIGGIIIVDYIDMHSEVNKQKIIDLLKKSCKKDRAKIQIEEFTKLNLLEMTRKHMFSNE